VFEDIIEPTTELPIPLVHNDSVFDAMPDNDITIVSPALNVRAFGPIIVPVIDDIYVGITVRCGLSLLLMVFPFINGIKNKLPSSFELKLLELPELAVNVTIARVVVALDILLMDIVAELPGDMM
jgi:hypothetical protein